MAASVKEEYFLTLSAAFQFEDPYASALDDTFFIVDIADWIAASVAGRSFLAKTALTKVFVFS